MDVHAHTHTERKKISHYLWEFLMLFLAVFCGFLAENKREHIVEHKRAKVLAQSMLEDLKTDTAALNEGIYFSHEKINASNTAIDILHSPAGDWDTLAFYKNLVQVLTRSPFISTKGTYEQVKASGSLRYFDQGLVNLMNAYDVQVSKTEQRDNIEAAHISDRVGPFITDIVNVEVTADLRSNKPVTHEMYLNISGKPIVRKFINLISADRSFRIRALTEYEAQVKIAERLIAALKKEYHLN